MEYDVDKWDLDNIDDEPMNKKNPKDVKSAKEYCEEHERMYSKHKCKPIWDRKTGELQMYEIDVYAKKEKD